MASQITKQIEIENQKSFILFTSAIKSPSTRKVYTYDLYRFLAFTKVQDFDTLASLDTDTIQDHLENYVLELRKQGITSIKTRLGAPELFFEMNKKLYHKKVLHKLVPTNDRPTSGDIPFTNEDIQNMLAVTPKLRTKAIIHFLASTGVRPGAIADPPFQLKHLIKMPQGCYAIKVYDESKEGYWAFLTPEATDALNKYLDTRKINGEKLTEDSYIFATYNTRLKVGEFLTYQDLASILKRIIPRAGIVRNKINRTRYDKAMFYGFRKRFNTILKLNNEVNSNIAEKLMAHKNGLDGHYLKPTMEQCFNEFAKAIVELTVSNKERDRLKIEKLNEEKGKRTQNEISMQQQINDLTQKLHGVMMNMTVPDTTPFQFNTK